MRRGPLTAVARLGANHVLVGATTVVSVIAVVILIFGGLTDGLFSRGGERVTATFSDTGALFPKSAEVRERGLKVGDVKGVDVDQGGRSATVRMEISKDGLPLYRDATATIRWRSVLGGTVIVELDRGTPAAGEMSTPRHIPLQRTHTQVELDQVASVLRGDARDGLKTLLAETPRALAEPTQPARALGTLADVAPSVRAASRAIRGQREGDLRELVLQSSRAAKALDRPRAVRDFVQGAAVTLETTAGRAPDLRRTIDLAGRIQPRIRTTLAALDSTLDHADPLIEDLREPAGQVASALARLRPVLSRTSALLHSARPLLRSLRPAASGLARAARIGDPLLRELTPTLERSDNTILKSANEKKDRFNGLTLRESFGPTMAVFDGLTAHFDHMAHVVRFAASIGERELNATPCGTFLVNPTSSQLVACKGLTEALNDVFTWHPVEPKPRKAGR